MPLSVGQLIHNDRYRIVGLLGQGGMGAVYRAWHMSLGIPVAIKENLEASPESQKQFVREAQILAKITHPNLPRVIDYFFLPGQGQYLVMDFVEGEDLEQMVERLGPVPEAQALTWMAQICDALGYLHNQPSPVIHRDIKPANIKINPQGKAMLVDFGLAKMYSPNMATTLGAKGVTPGFSPPEQYSGGTDIRSDIYALGATIYFLLTGQAPAESVLRLAEVKTLTLPRKINPHISPSVEQAVLRALELDMPRRFQQAKELREALARPETVAVSQVVAPLPAIAPTTRVANISQAVSKSANSKVYWVAGGILGLALLICLGGSLIGNFIANPTTPTKIGNELNPSVTAPATKVAVLLTATKTPVPIFTPTHSSTQGLIWKQGKLAFVLLIDTESQTTELDTLDFILGGAPEPVLQQKGHIAGPALSPNGRQIAFYVPGDTNKNLYLVEAKAGAIARSLADCSGSSWSPDGSQIVCRANDSETFLILNATDGSIAGKLPIEGKNPSWSPTRNEIVYAVDVQKTVTHIYRVGLDGNSPVLLVGDNCTNYVPVFSPDGNWIAYQSNKDSSYSEIWLMDREGNNARRITTSPKGTWAQSPSWSPDSRWLAFVSSQAGSIGADYGEVFVVSLETGETQQITFTGGRVYDWRVSWGK
jgi:serine/threonine protein kinase/roadblock/LC7 domain-containing protein